MLQTRPAESGAVCLGMVLGFHGRRLPIEELRHACGIGVDGSKASNLVLAGRNYGLDARQRQITATDLQTLPLPAIIGWGAEHFVVLEGITDDGVQLSDPAGGRRVVGADVFAEEFSGLIITAVPTADFEAADEPFSVVANVFQLLSHSRDAVALLVTMSLFLVIPGLIIPAFAQIFVDEVLGNKLDAWIMPLLLGMAGTAVLRMGLTWLREHHLMRLQIKLALVASTNIIWRILRLPMTYFSQCTPADVMVAVKDGREFSELLSGPVAGIAFNLICASCYAAMLLLGHLELALLGIGLTLLNLVVLYFAARHRRGEDERLDMADDQLYGTTVQGIEMMETLKAGGRESEFFQEWSRHQGQLLHSSQRLERHNAFVRAVPVLLTGLTNAAVLGYGGYLAIDGHITIGTLVAFQSLLASFSEPITDLMDESDEVLSLQETLTGVAASQSASIDPRLAREREQELDGTAAIAASKLEGRLELRNLSFGYSPLHPPLVEDFSLTLEPGKWVALVGKSGSGKSTVAKLVLGLFEPTAGEILFDGQPMETLRRSQLFGSMANVSQDVFLFDGSVRDNITLWNPVVPEDDVVEAARDACIHDVIVSRPGAYDSRVLEAGKNFSGGQSQRLGIARALVCQPTILVLDEATSDLDSVTERRLMENLRRRGCSVLTVAQRISTVRDCDEIIFIDHGKIVQRGSHEALSAVVGPYAELLDAE